MNRSEFIELVEKLGFFLDEESEDTLYDSCDCPDIQSSFFLILEDEEEEEIPAEYAADFAAIRAADPEFFGKPVSIFDEEGEELFFSYEEAEIYILEKLLTEE